MKVCNVVLRGRTSLDEVYVRTLVDYYEGVLELSGSCSIQPEVRLQRNGNLDTLWYVNEASSAPYGTVQCCKLVVRRRNHLHEVFPDHIGVFTVNGAFHVGIYYSLLCHVVLYVVIDDFAVILGSDTGKALSFCFRDSKLFEGVLYVLRNIFPLCGHFGLRLYVVHYVLYVKVVDVRSPIGFLHGVEYLQGPVPQVPDPFGIVLFLGYPLYYVFIQPLPDLEKVFILFVIAEVVD